MPQASVTFYKVTECGYYERDGEGAPVFGSLHELLFDFMMWAKDGEKKLGDTCTYHIEEASSTLSTYCYDCVHDETTGDFLLVTWNETSSKSGSVQHVQADAEVGNAEVEGTPLPSGAIPGYPTYFWFIPESNAYATVRFESPLNGNDGMKRLLKEFEAKFGEHCVTVINPDLPDAIEVLGYRNDENSDIRNLYPRFSSELSRQPGFHDYIKTQRSRMSAVTQNQPGRVESKPATLSGSHVPGAQALKGREHPQSERTTRHPYSLRPRLVA